MLEYLRNCSLQHDVAASPRMYSHPTFTLMEQLCPAVSPFTAERDVALKTLIQALGVAQLPCHGSTAPSVGALSPKALLQSCVNMQPCTHIQLEGKGY